MRQAMKIVINQDEDGCLHITAFTTNGRPPDGRSGVEAIGMLELAKMSLSAGRWGVIDGRDRRKKKRPTATIPNVIEQYIKARMEAEFPKESVATDK